MLFSAKHNCYVGKKGNQQLLGAPSFGLAKRKGIG